MGTDKASLEFRGRRLVDEMFDLLRGLAGVAEVVVSGTVDGLPAVPDERRGLGPLEGVRCAVNELNRRRADLERFLIVPVDMPLLNRNCLDRLLDVDLGAGVAAARFRDSELPLLIRNDRGLLGRLADLCSEATPERRRSFKAWLAGLELEELPRPTGVLLNANTPEEWEVVR